MRRVITIPRDHGVTISMVNVTMDRRFGLCALEFLGRVRGAYTATGYYES